MENFTKPVDSSKQFKLSKKMEKLYFRVFENSLILGVIFSHVERAKDLKNIRLVSRLWREMSINQWRRIGTLRLLWKKDTAVSCRYCQHFAISDGGHGEDCYGEALNLQEFFQMLKISKQKGDSCPNQLWKKPFSRYRIGYYCSSLNHNELKDEDLEQFWDFCGGQIKYLNLDHFIIDRPMYFEAIGWIMSTLSNLEELVILIQPTPKRFHPLHSNIQGRREGNDNLASVVCEASSKLESINLGFCRDAGDEAMRQISENVRKWLHCLPNIKNLTMDLKAFNYLQALQTPNVHKRFIQLQSLSLQFQESCNLNSYNILNEYLTVAKPPLETLKIGVNLYGLRNSLQKVLKSCQETLQHLELRSEMSITMGGKSLGGHLGSLHFPQLTKLYLFSEVVISFCALRDVPHLQTLWIQADNQLFDWNHTIMVEAMEERCVGRLLWRGMTHLHIDYYKFTPDSLRVIRRWMPNLNKVQLVLHKSTSELAIKIWPDVEDLFGSVVDHSC